MGLAPNPGAHRGSSDPEQIMTITVRDSVYRLAVGSVSIKEKLAVQKATGMAFESFLGDGSIGEVSLVVLVWLARRSAGEPNLAFTQAADEWPQGLTADDLTVETTGPDKGADDPEA